MSNPYPQTLDDLKRQYEALCSYKMDISLPKIKVPTHVVISEDDIVCTPGESNSIKEFTSNITLSTLPGGHASAMESPDEVARAILR